MGSLAFVAAVRAAWVVCKDNADPKRRLLLSVKNNLAADVGGGLAYTIESQGPELRHPWFAGPRSRSRSVPTKQWPRNQIRRGPTADERDEAATWLRQTLANGPQPAREVIDDADDCGYSSDTIQRVLQGIGGRREKCGFTGGWLWSLPEGATKVMDGPQHKELGTLGETWHLRENPGENGICEEPPRCQDAEGAKFPYPGVLPETNGQSAKVRGLCNGRLTPEEIRQHDEASLLSNRTETRYLHRRIVHGRIQRWRHDGPLAISCAMRSARAIRRDIASV